MHYKIYAVWPYQLYIHFVCIGVHLPGNFHFHRTLPSKVISWGWRMCNVHKDHVSHSPEPRVSSIIPGWCMHCHNRDIVVFYTSVGMGPYNKLYSQTLSREQKSAEQVQVVIHLYVYYLDPRCELWDTVYERWGILNWISLVKIGGNDYIDTVYTWISLVKMGGND